ncbi:DUF4232 domain-containing protein [Streptomyces sp. NBC_01304]|uniref:DUF4232 domain-containing protein n=1 Tax=Streptomyces sp. NBC_01304 TaxID=2903818 RepID=UPI002E0EFEDE|nr:DUF4232 domain-containing protein [Streptomyces sp. NBC_01304]
MNTAARRIRTGSRGWKSYVLGTAAAAALLATTACEPGSDDAADAPKTSDRPSATSSASPSAHTSKQPSDSGDQDDKGGDGDDSGTPLCSLDDLSVSATNYDAKGEPVRHILLVATNSGSKKCDIQNYPEVTLGDAQGPAPVKKGTDSGEVLTLAPGQKAYAGLLATGGHMDTYDVTSMTLGLGSPGGESEAAPPIDLTMPVKSFPADDGQRVTYWAGTEGLAMRPVTQS